MTQVSTLGQTQDNVFRLNQLQSQLGELQVQLASGKKTQRFKGLGEDAVRSQRARADFKALDTYTNNIKIADQRLKQMLNTLEEFQSQASNLADALSGFVRKGIPQEGDVVLYDDPLTPQDDRTPVGMDSSEPTLELKTLQRTADELFKLLEDFINVKEGDRFLLAGAQSTTKPLLNSSLLTNANTSLINDWKNGALSSEELNTALITNDASVSPRAITDSAVGYSPELSAGNAKGVFIRVDEFSEVEYTVLANNPAFRDILVALDFLRNDNFVPALDEVDPDNPLNVITQGAPGATIDEQKNNFYAVLGNIEKMVVGAIDSLREEEFKLEQVRATISSVRKDHEISQDTLLSAIDDIENADMNEVALQLNFLQIQLEASYRVTASLSELNLVNFI